MPEAQALQFAISALGGCVVGMGWWITNSITKLMDKVERVLVRLESHDSRIGLLERTKR